MRKMSLARRTLLLSLLLYIAAFGTHEVMHLLVLYAVGGTGSIIVRPWRLGLVDATIYSLHVQPDQPLGGGSPADELPRTRAGGGAACGPPYSGARARRPHRGCCEHRHPRVLRGHRGGLRTSRIRRQLRLTDPLHARVQLRRAGACRPDRDVRRVSSQHRRARGDWMKAW